MERTPLRHYIQYGHGILMLVFMLFTHANATETEMTRRLALLVAAPWEGETAMHNDVVATYNALRQRGFSPEELLVLEGPLTRSLLLTFLQDVHRRTALWQQGEVWFSFSGHGTFRGTVAAEARPGLLLANTLVPSYEEQVFWDEVFTALQIPTAVQLILLPDS